MKTTEEEMYDQAVKIRELIPIVVNGIDTSSMACCPIEVFHFAELYIKKLKEENNKLKSGLYEIAHHVSTPLRAPENYENTVYEFIDTAKRALGY